MSGTSLLFLPHNFVCLVFLFEFTQLTYLVMEGSTSVSVTVVAIHHGSVTFGSRVFPVTITPNNISAQGKNVKFLI